MGKAKATSLARDIGPSRNKFLNFFNFGIPSGKCKHFSVELSFGLEFLMFQRLHMESGMTSDQKLKYLKTIRFSILLGIKQGKHIFLSSTTLTNSLLSLTLSRGLLRNNYLKVHKTRRNVLMVGIVDRNSKRNNAIIYVLTPIITITSFAFKFKKRHL